MRLRPLSGSEKDATLIYLPLEAEAPKQATFAPPDPEKQTPGSKEAALLLRDALQLKLRSGAGPFRSFGKLDFDPRAYQLAPLLMALKMETIRLLIADDVGIGKTIEAGLIVKELLERGEIERFTVLCPPHLCEQWRSELEEKFNIRADVVRTGTVTRLERGLPAGRSIFDDIPFTIVSLDYIKQDKRRDEFLRACPDFVIVDEAHACVRSGAGKTRHRRYEVVKRLAESQHRSMVFLTATPHSGDQQAFSNLLGLLDERFTSLGDMESGDDRKELRDALARHFIQRRRADIKEWKDESAGFPQRESRETTYRLSGEWSRFFDDVLAYARTIVHRSEGGTDLQRRMSWWAALALLRCASSSPAAAVQALKTKLQAPEGTSDKDRVEATDRKGIEMVLDESDDDSLSLSETAPAGDIVDTQNHTGTDKENDIEALKSLIERTEGLRGFDRDPKLKKLIEEVASLIDDGFQPVVFCRYIATAHYVGEALQEKLKNNTGKKIRVDTITGELTPDQRKERIEALGRAKNEEESDSSLPLLVATDCLSEGINLQTFFDAAIHYDLAWNPTRHEQREGRVDRFGQRASIVRTLMLYGENNIVDWAVMRVILRKAEKIRAELGISVPLPTNNTKVIEAVMEAVLSERTHLSQERLFEKTEADVEREWRQSSERHRRTVFAQQSLKPEEALPEFQKATSALGGKEDVERFVHRCAQRLGAPLDERQGYRILPTMHLPKALQDRLEDAGLPPKPKIAFDSSAAPKGALYIHRAHPLVSTLAEHVVERALDSPSDSAHPNATNEDDFLSGARSGAFFTEGVEKRTVVFFLRLRNQITIHRQKPDSSQSTTYLLAEECLGVAIGKDLSGKTESMVGKEALDLLQKETGRNMDQGQRIHLLRQEIRSLSNNRAILDRIADQRASELLADHRRVRSASGARGRYEVSPSKPVDIIGVYILMPIQE